MASSQLTKTFSGASNRKTFTLSFWVKRTKLSTGMYLAHVGDQESNPQAGVEFNGDDTFQFWEGGNYTQRPSRLFRDTSAWYHIVIAVDTTQSTESDRVKIYVNGVQETVMTTNTFPSQNDDLSWNSTQRHTIGAYYNNQAYFDGLLSHIHFIDGTAYDADTFGETDSTSGIWKPKTLPSVTYGTNGFFLKFENSSDMGEDSSGNNNDFTTSGTITQTEDTPSNNFATWNPVSNPRIASGTAYLPTFSNGSTTVNQANATYYTGTKSSIGVSAGKWYLEAKCSAVGSQAFIGLAPDDDYGEIQETYLYENDGQINGSAYGNTYTTGDIIQIAFDADNGTVWFGKNGTWENSATQSEIEAGTTTNAGITGLSMTKFYNFATKGYNGATFQANFGNGRFGTTALASSNSDGAGLGLFEYSVPSGYYALCTKNIKNYG